MSGNSAPPPWTFKRFRATGDANKISFAGIMKANWRAIAAAEKVLDARFEQVVLARWITS